jgi:endoglucanase
MLGGVNLSCAEFGEGNLPGEYGKEYTYPTDAELDYFTAKGMKVFRLPFRWERLQQAQMAELDGAELARIDNFVAYATSKGAFTILDPHNYARYHGGLIGQGVPATAFADFWSKLADHYRTNDLVIFGLMNEPHDMQTELWLQDANAAIASIRATGASNLILVPGNAWTGAHSWSSSWYGTANAQVMLGVQDPGNHYAFEVHQYLDGDSSGTNATCVSATIGSERLAGFTDWLRANDRKGFLGEFAGARNDTCYAAVDDMLSHLGSNADVWLGWAWWAAGPWWGDYMFSLEPVNGTDRPQMVVLEKHL